MLAEFILVKLFKRTRFSGNDMMNLSQFIREVRQMKSGTHMNTGHAMFDAYMKEQLNRRKIQHG